MRTNSVVTSVYGRGVVQGRTADGWLVRYPHEQIAGFLNNDSLPIGKLFSRVRDAHTVLVVMPEKGLTVINAER